MSSEWPVKSRAVAVAVLVVFAMLAAGVAVAPTVDAATNDFESESVSEPDLEIEPFEDEFPDGTAGDDYGTVEIDVSETADVETENLEVELAVIFFGTEQVVFEETHNDTELQNETETFAFDVGSLKEAGSYEASVTVWENGSEAASESVSFELAPADAPTGTIDLEDPIFADQDEFSVDYTFENTTGGEAEILVVEVGSENESEVVSESVDEDGSIIIDVDEVGGIEAGDELVAGIYDRIVDIRMDDDSSGADDVSVSGVEGEVGLELLDNDSVVVEPPSDEEQPTFRITDVSPDKTIVEPGTELEVQTTIENTGTVDNETDVRVEIGDADASTREAVEIDASSEKTITIQNVAVPSEAGEYDIRVRTDNDQASESLTVETAPEAEVIRRCTTITESGEYVLGDDIKDVGGTCFTIAADEVVFDGDGHSITGTGTGYGIDVDDDNPLTGVRITNVSIRNFETGIHAEPGEFNQDRSIEITDVDASQNDEYGVELSRSARSVLDNLVVDENEVGLRLHVAEDTAVTNVTARENEDHGLELENSANENRLHNITVLDSDGHGVVLRGSDDNYFSDVEVVNSSRHGIIVHNIGISVDEPYRNVFENVTVAENDDEGILLGVAHQTELRGITAIDNDGNSIEMSSQAGDAASDNIIDGLYATGSMNGVVIGSSLTAQTASNNMVTNATIHGLTGVNSHAVNLRNNADETVVENVVIEDVSHGISNSGNDDVRIANVTMDGVSNDGIDVSGFGSTGTIISSVSMTDIGGSGLSLGAAEQSEIENVSVSDVSETGIQVQRGVENQLSNLSVTESTTDFRIEEETDTTVSNLDLESAVVSLHADNVSVNATDPSGPTPEDKTSLDSYVSLTPVTEDAYVESLRHYYEKSDISDIDESSLGVWRYDESWNAPADESYTSGVDTTNQTVAAEFIEEFSTFGVFGQEFETDVSPTFRITDISPEETTVEPGTEINVSTTIENTESVDNETALEAQIGDEDPSTLEAVEIDADSETTVTLENVTVPSEAGEYDIRVRTDDDQASETLTVEAAPVEEATLAIDEDESALSVEDGDTIAVVVAVTNAGDTVGTATVTASLGDELDEETVDGLEPGATESLEFAFDGDADLDGETVTVTSADASANATVSVSTPSTPSRPDPPEPASLAVEIDPDASRTTVAPGESVSVVATLTNEGERRAIQTIEGEFGGANGTEDVIVEGGRTTTVAFDFDAELGDDGERVTVRSEDDTAVVPVSVVPAEPANLSVAVDRNGSTLAVTEGETAVVAANVSNVGEEAGGGTVQLLDDGTVLDATEVGLGAGESRTVALGWNTTDAGTGERVLAVATANDTATETVRVTGDGAERSIADAELEPGETTTVSVTAVLGTETEFTLVESVGDGEDGVLDGEDGIPGGAEIELVDDDGAVASGVRDGGDELVATYADREAVTLVYEVTVPDDAADGGSYAVDGFLDVAGERFGTTGDDTVDVGYERDLLADREIGETSLGPGESTTVAVSVEGDHRGAFTVVESVGDGENDALDGESAVSGGEDGIPGGAEIELVDDDGAVASGVRDGGDELVATYADREAVTLVYEVTVPDDAADGTTVAVDGFVDAAGERFGTTGDDAIGIERELEVDVHRGIDDVLVEPGESTTVSVEAAIGTETGFTLVESVGDGEDGVLDGEDGIPGGAEIELVDDDGAVASGVRDGGDELVATYADREAVTLVYEVAVPDDAADAESYAIDGFLDVDGERFGTTGDGGVTAVDVPDGVGATYAERAEIVANDAGAAVEFGDGSPVAGIQFHGSIAGTSSVVALDREPEELDSSPGETVSVVRFGVPEKATDGEATVHKRVPVEGLEDGDGDRLRVDRFADGEWESLETAVVETTDDHVVLETETPGFSYFAVSVEAAAEPTEEPVIVTPAVVLVVLAALLAVGLLAWRRFDRSG